jgi:hypothetical protein
MLNTPVSALIPMPAFSRGLTAALFSSEGFDDTGLRFRHKQRVYPSPPALDGQPTQLALVFEGSDLFSRHEPVSVTQVKRFVIPPKKPRKAAKPKPQQEAVMFLARIKMGRAPEVSQVVGQYRVRAWTFCSYLRGAAAYGRTRQQAVVLARQALARSLMGKIYR